MDPKILEKRLKFNHPHLLLALGIDHRMVQRNHFFFEFCYLTLELLIQERIGTTQLFPEEDLMALLKGILSSLAYL